MWWRLWDISVIIVFFPIPVFYVWDNNLLPPLSLSLFTSAQRFNAVFLVGGKRIVDTFFFLPFQPQRFVFDNDMECVGWDHDVCEI